MSRSLFVVLLLFVCGGAQAQEVVLRHALGGSARDAITSLVSRFNAEQGGRARVILEDLADTTDRKRLPAMALLGEDDSRTFFDSLPRFKLLTDVMKEGGEAFSSASFLPQISDAIDDLRQKPQALPIGLALPVLFYNKDSFIKAGLDPEKPPRTWQEVQEAAGALADAGIGCPLTTSRFAWVHIENLASQHGEPAVSRSARGEKPLYNDLVHVKHLARLASWQKSRYFHYFGPGREADAKFLSGECAMLTGESALHGELRKSSFAVGIAGLPYYDDVRRAQAEDVLPDGAALYVLAGKKRNDYRVVARFVAFMMRPEVQSEWVRATGFLPMTASALDALAAAGVDPKIVAAARRRLGAPLAVGARMHAGATRSRVRAMLNEEIEVVWKTDRPPKAALDNAIRRASAIK